MGAGGDELVKDVGDELGRKEGHLAPRAAGAVRGQHQYQYTLFVAAPRAQPGGQRPDAQDRVVSHRCKQAAFRVDGAPAGGPTVGVGDGDDWFAGGAVGDHHVPACAHRRQELVPGRTPHGQRQHRRGGYIHDAQHRAGVRVRQAHGMVVGRGCQHATNKVPTTLPQPRRVGRQDPQAFARVWIPQPARSVMRRRGQHGARRVEA